jgi:hypothetical protein
MRSFSHVMTSVAIGASLIGCSDLTWETHSYPLGDKPEATRRIVDAVTTDQLKLHGDEVLEQTADGETGFVFEVVSDEGVVVVRTTTEGHRQICEALRKLHGAQCR